MVALAICFFRPTALVESCGGVIFGVSSTYRVGVILLNLTSVNGLGFKSSNFYMFYFT